MDELGEGLPHFTRTRQTYSRRTPTGEEYHEETIEEPHPRSRRRAGSANDERQARAGGSRLRQPSATLRMAPIQTREAPAPAAPVQMTYNTCVAATRAGPISGIERRQMQAPGFSRAQGASGLMTPQSQVSIQQSEGRRGSTGAVPRQPQARAGGGLRQPQSLAGAGLRQPQAPASVGLRQPQAPAGVGLMQPQAPASLGLRQPQAPASLGLRQPQAPASVGLRQPQAPASAGLRQPQARAEGRLIPPQAHFKPASDSRTYSSTTRRGIPTSAASTAATAIEHEGQEMSRTTTTQSTVIGQRNIISETSTSNLVRPRTSKLPTAAAMTGAKRAPPSQGGTTLAEDVSSRLLAMHRAKPSNALRATGTRTYQTEAPSVMTEAGPVDVDQLITVAQTVVRSPGEPEVVQHHVSTVDRVGPGVGAAREVEIQKLAGNKKTPASVKSQEVISVVSTLSTNKGVKSATKKVAYERGILKPSTRKPLPSPAQVRLLVQQETQDVDKAKSLIVPELESFRVSTYGIRHRAEAERVTPNAVQLDQNLATLVQPHSNPDEEMEDPSPELLANILNTQERGLEMDDMPSRVFDYLFANESGAQVRVDVSAAAPPPLQDVVVPVELPNQVVEVLRNPEVQEAGFRAEQVVGAPLTDNVYMEMASSREAPATNVGQIGPPKKKKYKNQPMISKETPPWGLYGIDQVVNVVGAAMSETMTQDNGEDEGDGDEEPPDPAEDGIEYILELEAPKHNSCVQLRGSLKPPWFPGYVLALPEIPDLITLVKSPSQVLTAAWRATVPNIFEESSLFVA